MVLRRRDGTLVAEVVTSLIVAVQARVEPLSRFVVALLACSALGIATVGAVLDRLLVRSVLDRNPATLFPNVDAARRTIWGVCAAVAIAQLILLAHFFVRARKNQLRLDEHVRTIEAQLVQADKLCIVGKMTAAIAHQINNPLGNLMGTIEMLESRAHERTCPVQCQEELSILAHEIGRLGDVLRSVLAFARKSDRSVASTDVNRVLEELVQFVGPLLAHAKIRLVPEYQAPLPSVLADSNQLKQVFLNLIQNAKDAMTDGGTIRLRTGSEDGRIWVEVIDSGTGIPPELMRQIFDPFVSTQRDKDGSGLGLSVSYGIIKAHGGSITASSQPGQGSTFRVALPGIV